SEFQDRVVGHLVRLRPVVGETYPKTAVVLLREIVGLTFFWVGVDDPDPGIQGTEKFVQIAPVAEHLDVPKHFPSVRPEVPAPAMNRGSNVDPDGEGGIWKTTE